MRTPCSTWSATSATSSIGFAAGVERLIEEYQSGAVPFDAPMTLVADYMRRFGVEYLERQAHVAWPPSSSP
jgi:uncharacterized protein YbgA (DUF1722 family)